MVKLTELTEKGGCGCKIGKEKLTELLKFKNNTLNTDIDSNYKSFDDCSVNEFDNENYLLNTLDFFSPIVDDPYFFGQISALNAVSDIYAMGGKPINSLSILGWPKDLSINYAKKVLEGASKVAEELNFSISGGHSIENPQPLFGLSVSGIVRKENIKRVFGSSGICQIYTTKPIGLGIISSALKKGVLDNDTYLDFKKTITTSNEIGAKFGKLNYVTSMTDISGFGLIGHLSSICSRNNLSAIVNYNKIPKIKNIQSFLNKGITTSITKSNFQSTKSILLKIKEENKNLLFDPQTNGGLLILVKNEMNDEFQEFLNKENITAFNIGETKNSNKLNTIEIL